MKSDLTYDQRIARQRIVEDVIRATFDEYGPDLTPGVPLRTGIVVHRNGRRHVSPGAWFPVRRDEVEAARHRAFRCGVTVSTWMEWHLLRRNYEADPAVHRSGVWIKVKRDPPGRISYGLRIILTNSGVSMLSLADQIDDLGSPPTEDQQMLRQEIGQLFCDMCRPLAPRRSRGVPRPSRKGTTA